MTDQEMMDSGMDQWKRGTPEKRSRGLLGRYLMSLADGLHEGTLAPHEVTPLLDQLSEEIGATRGKYIEPSPPGTTAIQMSFLEILDLYAQCLDRMKIFAGTEDKERLKESKLLAERAIELGEILESLMKENDELLKDYK
jgi:hypothetical protein